MTPQEIIYGDKRVLVTGIISNRGKVHLYVKNFVGKVGTVLRESKNNMLLVEFISKNGYSRKQRSIPAGCVKLLDTVNYAGESDGN